MKLFAFKFSTKKTAGAHVYLLQEWIYGARKIDVSQILYCTEMGKWMHIRAERCQIKKVVQIKDVQN